MWFAATAVDAMCCQLGKKGLATGLGDNKRLQLELKDIKDDVGTRDGTIAVA
ncbi:MAG: hypothetical protein Q9210_005608 [Variospora velana]